MSWYRDTMDDDVQKHLEALGAVLRDARVKAYMTQSDVAERAGVSRQLVGRIEQGLNGEISAYVAVASALNHRLGLVQEAAVQNDGPAGLEFAS